MQRYVRTATATLVSVVLSCAEVRSFPIPIHQTPQTGHFTNTNPSLLGLAECDETPNQDFSNSFSVTQALAVVYAPCDLDASGRCDCQDIDLITTTIGAGGTDDQFDLNGDGIVNSDDREFLILNLMGVPYGDVNFDGQFDSQDLLHVFQAGHYGDQNPDEPVLYCEGDWNGDSVFDSSDLVLVFQHLTAPSSTIVHSVPEPAAIGLVILGLSSVVFFRRRARGRHRSRPRNDKSIWPT
jgi:hypothetical protein